MKSSWVPWSWQLRNINSRATNNLQGEAYRNSVVIVADYFVTLWTPGAPIPPDFLAVPEGPGGIGSWGPLPPDHPGGRGAPPLLSYRPRQPAAWACRAFDPTVLPPQGSPTFYPGLLGKYALAVCWPKQMRRQLFMDFCEEKVCIANR